MLNKVIKYNRIRALNYVSKNRVQIDQNNMLQKEESNQSVIEQVQQQQQVHIRQKQYELQLELYKNELNMFGLGEEELKELKELEMQNRDWEGFCNESQKKSVYFREWEGDRKVVFESEQNVSGKWSKGLAISSLGSVGILGYSLLCADLSYSLAAILIASSFLSSILQTNNLLFQKQFLLTVKSISINKEDSTLNVLLHSQKSYTLPLSNISLSKSQSIIGTTLNLNFPDNHQITVILPHLNSQSNHFALTQIFQNKVDFSTI